MHPLIDRYFTDTELQDAYDRVTSIAQRPNENGNDYADRVAAAARDCANVFKDHALVHYYVRGLLATCDRRPTKTPGERTKRPNGYPTTCYGARKYVSSASTGGVEHEGPYESENTDSNVIRRTGPPEKPEMRQERTASTRTRTNGISLGPT